MKLLAVLFILQKLRMQTIYIFILVKCTYFSLFFVFFYIDVMTACILKTVKNSVIVLSR